MTDVPSRPHVPAMSPVTRRTIVKTAGNAAWAAPALLSVTAAPAFATSHNIDLDINTFVGGRSGSASLTTPYYEVTVKNNGLDTYDGTITLTLIVDASSGDASLPRVSTANGGSNLWVMGGVVERSTGFTATFTQSVVLAPGGVTNKLRARFESPSTGSTIQTGGSGSVQVTTPASSSNGLAVANYPSYPA